MNNITITGQLGKDSEIRATTSGDSVLSFSVADSQGRDKPTIWWNCQLWGKRASSLEQYLVKGQSVTVAGSVSEREWTDKDGVKRKSMDIRVNDIALQGGKQQAPAQEARTQHVARQVAKVASGFDSMDDDIPF